LQHHTGEQVGKICNLLNSILRYTGFF
jgi:hypothetical protein